MRETKESLIGKYLKVIIKNNIRRIYPKEFEMYGLQIDQYRYFFGSMEAFYVEVEKYHVDDIHIDENFVPTDLSYMTARELSFVLLNMVRKAKGMELLRRKGRGKHE